MKKKIIILYLISCTVSLSAQQNILQEVEQNNTVLSALRHQTEADKTENKTGLYPENPEVEFGYLWGNSDETRTDWSVSQSLDFPTAYHHKKKFSDLQNRQLDLQYQIERKDILLEASTLCIQLIYWNALSDKLEEQLKLTQQVADSYRKKYEAGDASLLDLNKAQYDLTDALKEYRNAVTEREFVQSELTRLNGGISFQLTTKTFPRFALPLHFESWYEERKEKNQLLKFYRQSVHLSRENEKLQRSLNLPKIKAGYMSEKVTSEHFQGVTVGISVPLWENKNTVKKIKAQTLANQEMEKNETLKDYHQTLALYKKVQNLQQTVSDIKKQQEEDKTVSLLKKSLDLGEISLIDFILELGIYYDMQQSMLEMERDLHLAASELMQWEN